MTPGWNDPSAMPRADRMPATRSTSEVAARHSAVAVSGDKTPPRRRRWLLLVLLILLLGALLALGVLIWIATRPDNRRELAPALQPAALTAVRYVVADETRDWRTACELETPTQHQGLTVDECAAALAQTPASLIPTFRHGTATCAGHVGTNPGRVRVLGVVDRSSPSASLPEAEQQPAGRWLAATRRGPTLDPPPANCPPGTQPLNPPLA